MECQEDLEVPGTVCPLQDFRVDRLRDLYPHMDFLGVLLHGQCQVVREDLHKVFLEVLLQGIGCPQVKDLQLKFVNGPNTLLQMVSTNF